MDPIAVVLVLLAVGATVVVITAPLRTGRREREDTAEAAHLADLETAKEAKYREIRDAELDFRTGKLSEADWRAIDRELRAEAMELLRRLDEVAGAR
jgi:type II secretory pathway pseudopilin PulG